MAELIQTVRQILAEQYADRVSIDISKRPVMFSSLRYFSEDLRNADMAILSGITALLLLKEESNKHFSNSFSPIMSTGEIFTASAFSCFGNLPKLLDDCISFVDQYPRFYPALKSSIEWISADSPIWPQIFEQPLLKIHALATRNDLGYLEKITTKEIQYCIKESTSYSSLLCVLKKSHDPRWYLLIDAFLQSDREVNQIAVLGTLISRKEQSILDDKKTIGIVTKLMLSSDSEISMQAIKIGFTLYPLFRLSILDFLRNNLLEQRNYLLALGFSGLPIAVDRLIEFLDDPEYARVASMAISIITGSLPEFDNWEREVPR